MIAPATVARDTGPVAWRFVLILAFSASCIRSVSEDCGGSVCASGRVCLAATSDVTVCIDASQFAGCRQIE